jgi:hypothetical protein
MTKVGVYALDTSTPLESNKSLVSLIQGVAPVPPRPRFPDTDIRPRETQAQSYGAFGARVLGSDGTIIRGLP